MEVEVFSSAVSHTPGVIAYSIGIAWAAQDELEYIATDPDREHSFFVDEFDNLYKYVSKIIDNICNEFNSQPRNWTIVDYHQKSKEQVHFHTVTITVLQV